MRAFNLPDEAYLVMMRAHRSPCGDLPPPCVAQENTTTVLIGRVTVAGADAPLPYASVTLNGKNAQFTDSTGRFQVEGIAAGDVTVRARRIGYSPAEQVGARSSAATRSG